MLDLGEWFGWLRCWWFVLGVAVLLSVVVLFVLFLPYSLPCQTTNYPNAFVNGTWERWCG